MADLKQLAEQIVNLTLRGAQYVVVGNKAGLDALERAIAERTGSPKAFQLVPGIDIPFHSSVLRDGVADFRAHLESLLAGGRHAAARGGHDAAAW